LQYASDDCSAYDAERFGERLAATMANCGTGLPACPLDLKLGA